jgi:hypothetical protein
MIKVAAEKTYREKRKELRVLKRQVKKITPKTEREKKIERLAGKKWTPGQYLRGAGIGGAVGALGHVAGTAIEGTAPKSFRSVALSPRALTRSAAIGALYGAALPAATRLANIEAAKRGKF